MTDSICRDEYWMAKAIQLAKKGRYSTTPNPNVGCVLVKNDQLIGEGYHRAAGTPHAEIHALNNAKVSVQGATAYVTLEPCSHFGKTPPCADALIQAGVGRVVCAMLDPNPLVAGKGIEKLRKAGIDTRTGVLLPSAEALNEGFLKRMRTGMPKVTVKMASSLDGATAMANGESQWITGPEARADVQQWRARACAIVTGVNTVIADNPSLNVRLPHLQRQPKRVILDTQGRIPLHSTMVNLPGETYVIHSDLLDPEKIAAIIEAGFRSVPLPLNEGRIDLDAFMQWLAAQELNEVWVESGATLAGAFLQSGWVDEVVLYQAPKFLGANTRPVIATKYESLAETLDFHVLDVRFIGSDIRWRLQPKQENALK